MTIAERNALLPKFDATRVARDRVRAVAAIAENHLREIEAAVTSDDDDFALQQRVTMKPLSAAIARIASIEAIVAEIKVALPAIKTAWEA